MFSPNELAELGERLAGDGTARHERALQEIALAVAGQAPAVAGPARPVGRGGVPATSLRCRVFGAA